MLEGRNHANRLGWVVVAMIVIVVILGNAQSWFSPAAKSPTMVGTVESFQGGLEKLEKKAVLPRGK